MKRTDIEKNNAKKIIGNMQRAGTPDRFAQSATDANDRREQRKRDQAAGLVPFAVKLPADLISQLHAAAQTRQVSMNDLVGEMLGKALADR